MTIVSRKSRGLAKPGFIRNRESLYVFEYGMTSIGSESTTS